MNNETGVEQCRHLIEVSLDWGDPASWTKEDFDELSDRIFEKTTVRLSVSTLKRIWGKVKYDHSPTTATLNALARYAGFESWRDFLSQNAPLPPAQAGKMAHNEAVVDQDATGQPNKAAHRSTFLTPLVIGTIALVALLALLSARFIHAPANASPLRFESRRTTDELPNSVVFDYDATPLHPKEVIIQQSWDPRRREKVDPNGKQHTSLYYYPGYFSAKLIVDGVIRRESEVYVTTKGWKAIVGRSPYPVYLSAQEIKNDSGELGVGATTLAEKTGSPVFSDTWVTFADVRPFPGISGDHFSLTAALRNTSTVEQCLCRHVRITLLGKKSAIIIPLSDKGCIASLQLFPGFNPIDGKDHDLCAFGCDFHEWQRLVCTEKEHVFTITLNDRPVFRVGGARSIGDIVG
ncbi:MAG TPA: hypothetical protein VHW43_09110, partial [Puia sp.]|nr:hypothetical protein [Puia sp.]